MTQIRLYQPKYAKALWYLFFSTVRMINIKDYSLAQVTAWAPESFDMTVWENKMASIQPFVAELEGVIVGYADLQPDGLIDHFFCHHAYQGRGVGRALMNYIFSLADERKIPRLYSHVSITAKPFFERFGFSVESKQAVELRGQVLTNYQMERSLRKTLF
ncbi:putative N-acetyltransferase YafP [Marinomonas spartinae]|uniref:Putative N-acetyltransferase YafP n=1 Tax=Marinomonas spartinae TaxID=1792290 RepID=A0A1A8TUA1_9GAMM|nr:GNAT family N-acetyltransferase [Marinomonas spartinae]SBS37455.1 putative N-acetyltransferase YafP [Marinomonas spartinae]